MTGDIIAVLSADLAPVSHWYVARRLFVGAGAGIILSATLMLVFFGLRPDIHHAMGAGMFMMKQAYTLAFAIIAGLAAERLARPATSGRGRIAWVFVPLLLVTAVATVQLARATPHGRIPMVMGESASVCPWRILLLAIPPLAGLVWAMRGLAPTRLREAGAVVGLAAGGAGAFIYALHCTENTAPFLAAWYTLGMGASAFFGWLFGPVLLRWDGSYEQETKQRLFMADS